ncbi:uncharacterized protein GLRG_02143 [Colletotrichum graminicola M1.001]|uniref:Mid2 domain-containing protein n=1 Tax=Colletotrichum graminicola (strain M1.001 / M2 / FGSC 10212) TaxID=645133 RepID=E3Q7W0_COLGM|nr:uncharacterized protein GLRG_02143 [Colletotrichum graminicola M1.001]EFQ26972.1 hypothetical protein GLRG_02143 [Colletotrichum graminicola M1.001]
MRSLTLFLFAFVTLVLGQPLNPVLGQSIYPDQDEDAWRIVDKKKIAFNTTLRHYTIGLWQQAPPSAMLGGIPFRILDAKGWGTDGNQGNQTLRHISSTTFTISDGDPGTGPAPSRPSTTLREPTKTMVLSRTAPADPSSSPPAETSMSPLPLSPGQSEAASPTDLSITLAKMPVGTSEDPGLTRTTGERGPVSTGNDQATQTDETDSGGSSAGLPVGARAGIGVGVGILGVTCIICAAMLYRHLKMNQRTLVEAGESTMTQPPAYFHGMASSPVSPSSAVQSSVKSNHQAAGFYVNPKPVEID